MWTPLICAVNEGHVKCITRLLEERKIYVTLQNNHGCLAIHLAAEKSCYKVGSIYNFSTILDKNDINVIDNMGVHHLSMLLSIKNKLSKKFTAKRKTLHQCTGLYWVHGSIYSCKKQ